MLLISHLFLLIFIQTANGAEVSEQNGKIDGMKDEKSNEDFYSPIPPVHKTHKKNKVSEQGKEAESLFTHVRLPAVNAVKVWRSIIIYFF